MADIRFLCDKCGQKLRVDEEASGLKIACPGCGNMLVVPALEDSVPPPPPPVPPPPPEVPANPQPPTTVPPVALAPAVVTATPPPQPVVATPQPTVVPQPVAVAPQPVAVPRVKAVPISPEPVVVTAAPAPVQAVPAAPIPVQPAPAPVVVAAPQAVAPPQVVAAPVVVAPQPVAPAPKVKKQPTPAQLEAERRQQEALLSQRPAGSMTDRPQPVSGKGKLGIEPIGAHLSRAELDTAAKLSKNNGIIFWGVALAGVVVMFIAHMILHQTGRITNVTLHVILILAELTWTSIWGAMGMKHLNRAHVLEGELKERKKKRRI